MFSREMGIIFIPSLQKCWEDECITLQRLAVIAGGFEFTMSPCGQPEQCLLPSVQALKVEQE